MSDNTSSRARYNTDLKSLIIAQELVDFGLRSTLVCRVTGLQPEKVRTMYRDTHGISSPRGTTHLSQTFLGRNRNVLEASVFLSAYIKIGGSKVKDTVDYETLIKAAEVYQGYREVCATTHNPLSPDLMYILCRDLRSESVKMVYCKHCGLNFVQSVGRLNEGYKSKCPIRWLFSGICDKKRTVKDMHIKRPTYEETFAFQEVNALEQLFAPPDTNTMMTA